MNPSFRFIQPRILALVAAAGVLAALAPATSQAQNNTYYGTGALQSGTTTGVDDSAYGVDALHDTTNGASNTATGFNALSDNTTGAHNTADGQGALALNTTGTGNTAVGMQALFSCKTDSEETATGFQALYSDTVGSGGMPNQNVALGYQALFSSTDGFENLAAGYQALYHSIQGDQNTALGYQALFGLTTGVNNIGIGHGAGILLTSGSGNIDIGSPGLASDNAVIRIGDGTQAATWLTGVIHGDGAGLTGITAASITGYIPGSKLTGGSVTAAQIRSGALGSLQLAPNLTFYGNTTIANEISLPATDSSGSNGVLNIGGYPFLNAIGVLNTFVGGAGNFTMTGPENTAIGAAAFENNSTGGNNTAIGFSALQANSNGTSNTAIGVSALTALGEGDYNIGIGSSAGANLASGGNDIYIGDYNSTTGYSDENPVESNTIRLGEVATQTATYIAGIYGRSSTDPSAMVVYIDKTGHVVTSASASSTFTEISLPATSSSTAGVLAIGGSPFLNAYGLGNTFVGGAGNFTTTGRDNTGAGRLTLSSNTTGSYNAANGFNALEDNTTGSSNTVTGAYCLVSNTSGRLNTAAGIRSLFRNTTGVNNTAFGAYSGVNLTTGSNNIDVGDYNYAKNYSDDVAGETDTIRIGELFAQTATYIAGIYGAASADPTATPLYIDQSGHVVTSVGAGSTFEELSLPATSSSTAGVLAIDGSPFLSAYGMGNTFVGGAGNFTMTGVDNTAAGRLTLSSNTTGVYNAVNGFSALEHNTTGSSNTVAGAFCLYSNTTGRLNTAIGVRSLYRNTSGVNNTAVGAYSGVNLTTGSDNIDVGDYNYAKNYSDDVAGETNTIRIGELSTQTATYIAGIYGAASADPTATVVYIDAKGHLVTSSTAALNLPAGSVTSTDIASGAVGSTQLGSNITLSGNTTIGSEISLPATDSSGTNGVLRIGAHPFLSDLNGNAFVGGAGNFTMTGVDNVATGGGVLEFDTTGSGNTVIGLLALSRNTTGGYNTASGLQALYSNTTGGYNVAGGFDALVSNTAGNNNTASGVSALQNNATGSNNTAAGYSAGGNLVTGSNDIDLGDYNPNTGQSDDAAGESNTIRIGGNSTQTATYIAGVYGAASTDPAATLMYIDHTGHVVTSSTAPVMLATSEISLPATSSGTSGVLEIGGIAFLSAPGTDNTFVGGAGNVVLTGSYNTAGGFQALHSDTSGENNTASGFQALYSNGSGYGNTASGEGALALNTTGYYNTAMGSSALYSNTGGANNLAAGFFAGSNLTTGSNNIDLGDSTLSAFVDDMAGESNTIRIGELSTQTAAYIAGIYNQSYNANDSPAAVFIDSTGKLGTMSVTPSSRQFKKDIKPMADASDVILSLKPVTFQYIKPEYDPRGGREFGLIAEEVDKICPDLVAHNKDGAIYGIRYDAINAMLLNEFLKQHQRVEQQDRTIAQQQKAIEELTASLKEQGSLLQKVSAQIQLMKPAPQVVANTR